MIVKPRIALCGMGRAGKDTAGEYLGRITELRYVGSLSQILCPLIAEEQGVTPEEAWANRHAQRVFWYEWANEYRKHDPARLIKESLSKGEIVVGVRDRRELFAARDEGLLDQVVWIERPGVPVDPTVTYTQADCDVTIYNTSDLAALYAKLQRWALFSRLPLRVESPSAEQAA